MKTLEVVVRTKTAGRLVKIDVEDNVRVSQAVRKVVESDPLIVDARVFDLPPGETEWECRRNGTTLELIPCRRNDEH